ncbi:transcriptional repressor NF-X1 [Kwoniella heveanensis BCC8398]|uniref:Transcriptional repressor NF-X1 n=1 Tax=Kwoniella heveanensis BCC8398 TaxID=1296120 RepID=A0A1B9GRM6_9TREE|nr:transcriptional repressor NF-X1 [Kwoniella heveanensis BCC8398]
MAQVSTFSRPMQPQPGDGAFLSSAPSSAHTPQPQPGDGAYLASQARQARPNGPGSSGMNKHQHQNQHQHRRQGNSDRSGPATSGGANGQGQQSLPPRPSSSTNRGDRVNGPQRGSTQLQNGSRGSSHKDEIVNGNVQFTRQAQGQNRQSRQHAHQQRNGNRTAQTPQNLTNGLSSALKSVKVPQLQQAAPLDADAAPFTPGQALLTSDLDHSGVDTPSGQSSSGKGQERKRNHRSKQGGQKQNDQTALKENGGGGDNTQSAAVTGRKAAFQQSNKLTTSTKPSVDNTPKHPELAKNGGGGGRGGKKKDEPDDLVSRLTRGLKSRPFLECPICFNNITPGQPIWSCLPPDHAPEPSSSITLQPNPITGSTSTSNYYSACYTPFHLDCIKDWADRSLEEEQKRAHSAGRDGEDIAWRCPGCQKRRADRVAGYRCFCGRLTHPPTSTTAPHSCNDSCARKRPKCSHPCPLPCHPGPCPPCQVALVVPCPSHHTPLTVKCSAATSNNAAMSPVCDEPCSRQLNCGNKDHECDQLCHYGPCKPCDQKEVARCYCGDESKQVECGWERKNEKICARLDSDGEEETWWGKYDCGKACDRLFDCGIHPCQETCHPHPIHPLKCPKSPEVVTHCPCGTTLLSSLPGYPRPDCLAPIPTCTSQCPKNRPCGHPCPKKCHTGPCPPCHEEVVKTCRCGQSQLLVPCDELRERAERGEDEVTCERVCKALRSCGRHECGRLCCPLWELAKFKNRKQAQRNDDRDLYQDDDLHKCHLTCGRMLSCGLHTCPKPDHKGPCGRCLQASYDELICHCGNTVIYPPVACGTTINCPYPCDRPAPACGHPKTSHPCHESPECPPCPYLTNKSCACGKDPSVKNVRCSQDRVSCGQPCGRLLDCGYHKCTKLCHRPGPPAATSSTTNSAPEDSTTTATGECETCTQVCGKPKRICKHACTSTCHAPFKCPENEPCQTIVTQSCTCGNLQSRTSCGSSTANPKSREVELLKCNSECAIRQRNARLADALGIKANERGQETYEDELRSFAAANHAFVKTVETTFEDFFKGPRQTMVLPHMPLAKRTFVMSLAEHYRLTRELIDQEPNRSVQIRRRVDTRIPSPLLSASVTPAPQISAPAATQSKLVTTMGNAWGRSGGLGAAGAAAGGGTIASIVAGGSSSAGAGGWGSVGGGSASSSARPSRAATPVAPILRERDGMPVPHPRVVPSSRSGSPKRKAFPSATATASSALASGQTSAASTNGASQVDGVDDWDVDV